MNQGGLGNQEKIKKRVIQAAEAALEHQFYVSPLDVLVGMGALAPVHIQDWRKGKIPHLEGVIQGNLHKISFAMKCFRKWAVEKGLNPKKTVYLARTRGPKKALRFSKSGRPGIEEAYQTHYVSPLLSAKKQEKLKEKLEKPPELVAFSVSKGFQCSRCQEEFWKGSFLYKEGEETLCLSCAGFGELLFLPRGDAALTRAAKKYSKASLVVVQYSRARKRYERQGVLVEETALQKAEEEMVFNQSTHSI